MPIKITPPGSKSITNRVLLLTALSNKKVDIKNIAICDDSTQMIKALKDIQSGKTKINTGNAGTTTRFITAFAALQNKAITVDGDKRMRERPINELTKALKKLGADIEDTSGCPPVKTGVNPLQGGRVSLKGNISSQYLSALLMVCPFVKKDTEIKIINKLCSQPYIQITLTLLKQFGLKVKNDKFKRFTIKGNQNAKAPSTFTIESDASGASYIGAYAALHPEKGIVITNVHKSSIQGDIAFLQYLKKMGCKINTTKNGTTIKGPKKLKPLGIIDMNETPDLVMTFTALAMLTPGITRITNIENLRIKETDRIQALENEIKKFGIKVKTGKSFIEIHGNPTKIKEIKKSKRKITIKTYDDHRIAMCFGILTETIPNIKIQNPKCVSKSYKNFWKDLKTLQSK